MKTTFVGERARGRDGLAAQLAPALQRIGRALGVSHCAVSIMLTDDEGIAGYNERFRGIAEATDVLSFPSGSGSDGESGHYLGDLILSVDRAEEQAADWGHPLVDELEVLLLHGVLHLLGHDHETDDGHMRDVEARLARELFGSTRGLCERSEDAARDRRA